MTTTLQNPTTKVPPEPRRGSRTIKEWCEWRHYSIGTFYAMKKKGVAPKVGLRAGRHHHHLRQRDRDDGFVDLHIVLRRLGRMCRHAEPSQRERRAGSRQLPSERSSMR